MGDLILGEFYPKNLFEWICQKVWVDRRPSHQLRARLSQYFRHPDPPGLGRRAETLQNIFIWCSGLFKNSDGTILSRSIAATKQLTIRNESNEKNCF